MKTKVCLGAMLVLSAGVCAQSEPSTESTTTTELDNLVVVAYKQARPVQEVVGDVTVIKASELNETLSQDFQEAIQYQSNIHIEDGGTRFGTSGINIRGIGGNRVAIEIDGIPNAKAFDLGSYSFATAAFPEIDLIQNIEILKGPASTLYGSDALGGIVAINTWDPDVLLARHDQENWTRLRMGYDGKRHGRFVNISSAWDFANHGLLLSASQRDGKGTVNENSHLAKDTADWDAQSLFGKWVVDIAGGNTLSFGIQAAQKEQFTAINSFIGQGRFVRTTALSGQDESNDEKFNITYDFNVDGNWADAGTAQLYYAGTEFHQDTIEQRFSRRGTPLQQNRRFNFDSGRIGLELNFTKAFNTENHSHQLIYGLEWMQTQVKESRDANETNLITQITSNVVLGENFPLRDFPTTKVQELGLFIHDEISISDTAWTLVPALRFDLYDLIPERDALFDNGSGGASIVSISEADFSPKVGIMYDVNDAINVYAQYVRGFRAPPYDDVNIGFNLALFNYQAIPNPDLKSETSNGFEMGFRFDSDSHRLNINVFHNNYHDLIVSRDLIGVNPETNALIFQSRNVAEATIYGAELTYQWSVSEQWSTGWQLGWTRGENDGTKQPLNHISPTKVTGNLKWQSPDRRWDAGLFAVFSQAKDRLDDPDNELFRAPGYATYDFIIGHQLTANSQLRLGIHNLTDKTYWLWQQVRNFDPADPIIAALTQASRHAKLSYSVQW